MGARPVEEILSHFRHPPAADVKPDKILDMVVKCIEVIDPKVKVELVEFGTLGSVPAAARVEEHKVRIEKQCDHWELLVIAIHEVAKEHYSNPASELRNSLNAEEFKWLYKLEEVRVNFRFCQEYPEFRYTLWNYYYKHKEYPEFYLSCSLWSSIEGVSGVMPRDKRFKRALLEDCVEAIVLAKSTEELIHVAVRLALNAKRD